MITNIDFKDNAERDRTFGTAVVYKALAVGSYTIEYGASDELSNVVFVSRKIIVTPDVTPPVINVIGPAWNVITVDDIDEWFYDKLYKGEWAEGATAYDAVEGVVKVSTPYEHYLPVNPISERNFEPWHRDVQRRGLYVLTYKATDKSGNSAVAYRKIQVIDEGEIPYTEEELITADFEPPVITLNGPEHVNLYAGDPYEEQGAKAEDAQDGAVVVDTGGGNFNTNSLGNYEVNYYAQDRFGNRSRATRYVHVIDPQARLLTFKVEADDSVTLTSCNTSIAGDLIIPSYWEGKPVKKIGEFAFGTTIVNGNTNSAEHPGGPVGHNLEIDSCWRLENVIIPDSVTAIGAGAFYGCHNLKSVDMGNELDYIGFSAFLRCKNLTSSSDTGEPIFIIPNGVKFIGVEAFRDCVSLRNVEIPGSVKNIQVFTFLNCISLSNLTLSPGIQDISYMAFSRCSELKKITIPSSVKIIDDYAFDICRGLESVTIGDSVTQIGEGAFYDCWNLKAVTFEGNAPTLGSRFFVWTHRGGKVYVGANATGFGTTFGGLPVVREGSITTASKGNTSDGPIMGAVVFFDANLNGLPDEGEPQTTSNGWGDYWLDIPLETYDLNDNGVIDISEGVIVSQGGTDTATGLPMKTVLKGPASATVITPLTTLVTRVMEQNPELDASAAANKLEDSLGIPAGIDILSFDTFKEASEENPSAADVLTATAKLQDTLVQGGNLIGGATGKSLQEGSDAVMDAIAQQVEAGNNVDLDSKSSLKSLITEAASTSGANLTEAQTDGAASIMEASSKAKEDARASASTVTELATEVSRVQAVSQSKAADDLEAVGAQTADLESTVLAYTGAAMQQQVQIEVVGDFNASNREAPVFAFQSASYTVKENGQQQPVIQINRTGDSFETVELTVTPITSSATAGEDFNGEPVSVSFEPLEIRKTLDLQTLLIDDVLAEEAETFSLQLEVVRDPEDPDLPELPEGEEDVFPDRPTVGTISLATLTIISDDIANEAPTVSTIEDLVISEGAAQVSADFSVTDTDSSFDELTVQASTSNPFLISGLMVEGTASEQDASHWILNFETVADRFGEGTITVEINDGYQIVSTSFNVTVSAVNNAPQISGVPSVIEAEGRKVVVPFEVSDDQTTAGNLFIYLTAQPLDYILKGHVLVVGNGAQRELILNNSGNAEGTGQFSVVVTDADGKTASQAFEVNFGGEPPVPIVPKLKLNTSDPSNLTLSWEGDAQLLFTEDLSEGFEVVAGAESPYSIEQGSMGFFILRVEP
ncbi:leucine-rich repeat protein [Verrucomicrobia bacterium]|nr:leucine-rich repeat protein [Verrucomicrobiota bacterium]